ncbi:MAG TPA: Uma2 family endonuclease [Planctomycetaceae bacterium]|nr:Uma2 family endonuclease [Planctomycetaceae bacterium]
MIELGILGKRKNLELIRGEVVEKTPVGDSHAACVDRLNRVFMRLVDDTTAFVRIQNPIVVLDSRPEPDVVLKIALDHEYATSAPRPDDILLLIEVADSSLEYDRTEKLSLYAEAGVGEYWIANVNNETVEVYRDPRPDGTYTDRRVLNLDERLNLLALPAVSIAVEQVFKSRRDS